MKNKFFKNWLNLKDKNLKWHNTNFFYVTTLAMVVGIVIGYFVFRSQADPIVYQNNFWNVYLMSFAHTTAVHITFNVIMFILLSLLLERHFGSFTYLIMLIFIIPIANLTCFAATSLLFNGNVRWAGMGESCVHNFLLGFVLVVAAFNYKKYILSKNAFIFFIPLAFIILFSSVNSNNIHSPAEFFANPSMKFMDAFYTNTAGHFAPFLVGVAIGLLIYTILLTTRVGCNKNH